MEVNFIAIGTAVWEIKRFRNGMIQQIKIRDCNTKEQAKAVANYYSIRKE